MAKSSKKVSRAALIARINRRLAKDGEALRQCPENRRDYHILGDAYVIDLNRNVVISKHVDLRRYAKNLGALKPGEVLAD
jgi:hypothetical protein